MSASSLQKKIDAKQIDSTQFLKISVTNANSELAKNIANELANVFTQQIKEIYNLQNISIVDDCHAGKGQHDQNCIQQCANQNCRPCYILHFSGQNITDIVSQAENRQHHAMLPGVGI